MKKENTVMVFEKKPRICGWASAVGSMESEGPLSDFFEVKYPNDGMDSPSWEDAETVLCKDAVTFALRKAKLTQEQIDVYYGGDLLNQCTATSFGIKEFNIPLAGLYGACSTFALGLISAGIAIEADAVNFAMAGASSHFCSVEKQFRMPLEYGGQRTPTAQRTVTGAGAVIIGNTLSNKLIIDKAKIGTVVDAGVADTTNMGAAMAPAAARTISDFFHDTNTRPRDYDLVLTGDLGMVGTKLLIELMKEEHYDIEKIHSDCGNLIFNNGVQDVHSGGSGAGCSACVFSSWLTKNMLQGRYKRILFVGTGALMSPLTALQGKSIPAIAHAVEVKVIE